MLMKHTYAICAYQNSPYLEECIRSLKGQTVRSDVLLATSTPNEEIQKLCTAYDIPLFINEGESGITQDWNFAYSCARTAYVTLAHQDDLYDHRYTEELLQHLEQAGRPILYFTDYGELRKGKKIVSNRLLKVKRTMLTPLKFSSLQNSIFVRRRILSFGCPICCPSVTFVKANCPETIFRHGFRSDEDWEAWEKLSRRKGAFVYNPSVLMYHRIHTDSETTKIIQDQARTREDYTMFRKFWPDPIAKLLTRLYSSSQKSNETDL
ncbi:MAG: glycosyltransferase [Eubacterium sp.]|nr:glycosyltransferase [Eubacterium sp.]